MGSGQCAYLKRGVTSRSCGLLVTAIAIVAIIAAFGTPSDTDAAGKRKSRDKHREPAAQAAECDDAKIAEAAPAKRGRARKNAGRRLDQTVLRYLPDDCRAFGWIDVAPTLESEMGRKLTRESSKFWEECRAQVAPLELKAEQVDRIVFGARAVVEGEASKAVFLVFCKQPVQGSKEDLTAGGKPWTAEKIGRRTVWVRGGQDPWAVCTVEDRVVLAGYPDPLRAVLKRDGPSELPEKLERARRFLDPSAAVAMTFLPPDNFVQMNSLPLAYDILSQIDAFNVEVGFDADLGISMAAICRDEAAAQKLNGIGTGLWALVQMQSLQGQQPEVRDLIRSVQFDVDGPVLTASMNVPSGLVKLAGGGTVKLQSTPTRRLAPAAPFAAAPAPSGPVGAVYPAPGPSCQPYVPATPSPYAATSGYLPNYQKSVSPYAAPTAIPAPNPWQPPTATLRTLQIADVIRLVEAGVDDEVIVRHIRKHRLVAALTADDLILLTKSEANTQVITTLQEIPSASKSGHAGPNVKGAPYRP